MLMLLGDFPMLPVVSILELFLLLYFVFLVSLEQQQHTTKMLPGVKSPFSLFLVLFLENVQAWISVDLWNSYQKCFWDLS